MDLDQVCLIRFGAKLCRLVALQELSLRSLLYTFLGLESGSCIDRQWGAGSSQISLKISLFVL